MLLTPHAWVSETPFGSEGLSSLQEEPGASLGVLRSKRAPACLEQHLLLGGTGPCSPESAVLKPGGGRGAQRPGRPHRPSAVLVWATLGRDVPTQRRGGAAPPHRGPLGQVDRLPDWGLARPQADPAAALQGCGSPRLPRAPGRRNTRSCRMSCPGWRTCWPRRAPSGTSWPAGTTRSMSG